MKVVFFSYDAPGHISGVDSWLKNLLPELQQRGVDVAMVFITRGAHRLLEKVRYFHQNQIATYTIQAEQYKYAEDRTRRILELLQDIKPDIVVPGYILSAIYASKWFKQAGIASVGVIHSDDAFYQAITTEFVAGLSAWRFDAAVGVSALLYNNLLEAQMHHPLTCTTCIPCGVKITANKALFTNELKLVYVGRLEEQQKQISKVVAAFCTVVNKFDGVSAAIYGDGSCKNKVQAYVEAHGSGKVVYKGSLPSEQVAGVLPHYHAIVLMSDYEGLPVALLEGMAAGLVPVCLEIESGINDVIEHMVNGIIIKNRDADFFAAIELLNDKELWEKLSGNARKTVQEQFSISITANQWLDVLKAVHPHAGTSSAIVIPDKMELPPLNTQLAWENEHKPATMRRIYNKIAWIIKRLKHRIFK